MHGCTNKAPNQQQIAFLANCTTYKSSTIMAHTSLKNNAEWKMTDAQ